MNRIKIVSDGKTTRIYSEDGKILKSVVSVHVRADITGCFADVTFAGPELDVVADIKEKEYE